MSLKIVVLAPVPNDRARMPRAVNAGQLETIPQPNLVTRLSPAMKSSGATYIFLVQP